MPGRYPGFLRAGRARLRLVTPAASCWTARGRRADFTYHGRYRALVLLATFASLRWGEATASRQSDLDLNLKAGSVRVRAAFVQRSTGEMLLGPPKSRAGRRIVGIPDVIIPVLLVDLAGPQSRRRPDPGGRDAPQAARLPKRPA